MLLGEVVEGADLLLGVGEQLHDGGELLAQGGAVRRQLRLGGRAVGLLEDGPHRGGDHGLGRLGHARLDVAHELHPAALPGRADEHLGGGLPEPAVGVAGHQLDAA